MTKFMSNMMRLHKFVYLYLICFLAVYCRTASGISCYQCLSTDHENPFQCNEYMTDADITAQSCDNIYNAQYCVKHTGRFEGGLGTKRFCSPLDLGNYCNYIQQPGDELEYRSCVYTCSTDGCNPASVAEPKLSILMVTISLAVINMVLPWVR